MIIQLTKKYRIRSVTKQAWAVQRVKRESKSESGTWTSFEWHGHLRAALRASVDHPRFLLDKKTKKECFEWMDKIESILKNNP